MVAEVKLICFPEGKIRFVKESSVEFKKLFTLDGKVNKYTLAYAEYNLEQNDKNMDLVRLDF